MNYSSAPPPFHISMHKTELLKSREQFQNFWKIMIESFPESERKTSEQYLFQLKSSLFALELLKTENTDLIGFIGWWQLKTYRFVEHFAISRNYRNMGFGKVHFGEFIKRAKQPILLEVEPPVTDTAVLRIRFYEQLGFTLHPYEYYQPPYNSNQPPVELLLMSSRPELTITDFNSLKDEIYEIVYDRKFI
jgi:ribosomal protein S18 acetylase RimI-like enzyme